MCWQGTVLGLGLRVFRPAPYLSLFFFMQLVSTPCSYHHQSSTSITRKLHSQGVAWLQKSVIGHLSGMFLKHPPLILTAVLATGDISVLADEQVVAQRYGATTAGKAKSFRHREAIKGRQTLGEPFVWAYMGSALL